MQDKESDAEHLKEYKLTLKKFAIMAADYPNMIGQLRVALKASASAMISNRPETVSEFQRLAEEIDAFLSACQTGEVDPHAFIRSLDNENS